MKNLNLSLLLAITGCLLSCGKGGAPSTTPTTSNVTYTASVFAGNGQIAVLDGQGVNASFSSIIGIAIDNSQNLYVTDLHCIRKISPSGLVSTLTGSAGQGHVDGPLASAEFNVLTSITVDAAGNIYVADIDINNYYSWIRKITPTGVVSTLAGSTWGHADGQGATAQFNNNIKGLRVDAGGNLFVSDGFAWIRKITPGGLVSTFAGNGTIGNIDGPGLSAEINATGNLIFDNAGNLYVSNDSMIKKITPAGVVSTFAGAPPVSGPPIPAAANGLSGLEGIVMDASGNFFVNNNNPYAIKKITPAGVVSTLTINGSASQFFYAYGLVVDNSGSLYICDGVNRVIKKFTPGS